MSIVSKVLGSISSPKYLGPRVALCSRSNFLSFPIFYKCNSYSTSGQSTCSVNVEDEFQFNNHY